MSHQPPPLRPQSTLSLNQLCSRRCSNPDIYPGARRFSTSYSHEDILSNDQLDQIHFDPRYRDYRSASSLNNCRSRSNSLNSVGSGGMMIHQYQQFRRLSNQSPPRLSTQSPPLVGVPLAQQKRWDTNPSIFIEEYNDDEPLRSKTESKSDSKSDRNSKETLCSSNESLQPLSECDIKSLCDLSEIPFIDEDSNEAAPCRFDDDDESNRAGIMTSGNLPRNACRKTVSFDVIAGGPSGRQHLFTNNGNNSPKNPHPISYPTDKNQLFLGSHGFRTNVRPSRDGINRTSHCIKPVPRSSSLYDDHCPLVDKLIRMRLEEERTPLPRQKCQKEVVEDSRVCEGKVKALTTYFNSLPYMMEDCNCVNVHQSTPDLSLSRNRNKLTFEEMEIVRKQLKEWSEFGLSEDKSMCFSLPKQPCMTDESYSGCKQYREMLNKLDMAEKRRRKLHHSMENMYNPLLSDHCFFHPKHRHCHFDGQEDNEIKVAHVRQPVMRSEKHKCRSPCYNIKNPAKKKKKQENEMKKLAKSLPEEDSESFVI